MKSIFKDKNGNTVIGQPPNLPIIVWFVAFLANKILPSGLLSDVAALVSFGALFTWAWMELFDGANLWRRILGTIVLVSLIVLNV